MTMIYELVEIPGQFKPSVQLPGDYYDENLNAHFVSGYIPTEDILDFFVRVKESIQPGNDDSRARIISGTFGTGKSDLMLMLANYVTRDADDPFMKPFYDRLADLNRHKAAAVQAARRNKPPFLLVLAQADTTTSFSSLVLNELEKSLGLASLPDLMSKTIYRAAVEVIEVWEADNNPNLYQLRNILENEHRLTVTQFKDYLCGPNADMYWRDFSEIFQRIVGVRFSAADAIQRPSDALKSVAGELVRGEEYSGIFIICDEFSHLLDNLAESPNDMSSKAIDNVAEMATRSGNNQVHFTVVSLEPFSSLKATTQSGQDALERSGGRFINGSFEMQSKNVEVLLGAAIRRLVPSDELFSNGIQVDELVSVTTNLYGSQMPSTGELKEKIILNCYPFHPITTYMLPRLNQRLAQNERTTFRFLWDDELGLSQFIRTRPALIRDTDWHDLVPVDYLFDYFASSLEQKRSDLSLAYEEARRQMTEEQFNGLEGAILRTLVLFEVLNDNKLRANQNFLAQALNIPSQYRQDLDAALQVLQDLSIAIPDNHGFFELNKPGRADPRVLRSAVEAEARHVTGSIVAQLNENHPLPDIEPVYFNQRRKAKKMWRSVFVTLNDLNSPARMEEILGLYEASILYVIPINDPERAEAITRARQYTQNNPLLMVAIPRSPSHLQDAYRKFRAYRDLRKRPEYGSEDYQRLLRDEGFVGKEYFGDFNSAHNVYKLPANLDFCYTGELQGSIQQDAQLMKLASDILERVYEKYPPHNQAQHLAQDKINAAVKGAIDTILKSSISIKEKGKRAAHEAVLVDGALHFGIIRLIDTSKGYQSFGVSNPTAHPSLDVWETIYSNLSSNASLDELIYALKKPPFGLYPPMIALYLAAFYYQNSDAIDVYRGSGMYPVSVTSDEIVGMVTAPKSYRVSYRSVNEAERAYFRGLVERVLFPGERISQAYSSTGGSLKLAVARAVNAWCSNTTALVRSLDEEVYIQVVHLTPIQAGVAVQFLYFGLEYTDTASVIRFLTIDLPVKLDIPQVVDCSPEQVDTLLQEMYTICMAMVGFEETLAEYVLQEIARIFDAVNYSRENREPLFDRTLEWFDTHKFIDPAMLPDHDAMGLWYVLRGLTDVQDVKPIFLKELPKRYDLEPVKEWNHLANFDKYIRRLQSAKNVVERFSAAFISPEEPAVRPAMHDEPTPVSATRPPRKTPLDRPEPEAGKADDVHFKPHTSSQTSFVLSSGFELPNETIFEDDARLDIVFRKVFTVIRDANLTAQQRIRLIDELWKRYGSKK